MKKLIFALPILSLSCGCVMMQIKPPADTAGKLQTIAVVPMEAPPLDFHPEGGATPVYYRDWRWISTPRGQATPVHYRTWRRKGRSGWEGAGGPSLFPASS